MTFLLSHPVLYSLGIKSSQEVIFHSIFFNEEWTHTKINYFQINQFGQVYDIQFAFHTGAKK